ncbi:MAG: hypothetical protein K0B15_10140 [Lentimicrobium sp.]|nr:hypothetical protein [Lentimicrobium sp.]
MKKFLFLLFVVLFSSFIQNLSAQDNRPVRMEIPVKDDSEIYKVVPCDVYGIMIIYLSADNDETGNMIWIAALLDKDFKETYRMSVPLPKGFSLQDALYSNNHLILFFHSPKGAAEDNFRIVDVDVTAGIYHLVAYTVPERSGMAYFSIGNEFALAGINTRSEESIILAYHFGRKQFTVINPGIPGSVVIVSINIDKSSGIISTVIRTSGSARKRDYFLVRADVNGNLLTNLQLSKFDDNRMINTAFSYRVDGNTDMILGSYGKANQTRTIEGAETIGVASTGFFSILIKDNQEVNSNFYEFTAFENFFRYLRRPSELNSRRSVSRLERGKDFSSNHDLMAHEVFQWNGQFVFMAEAYYPEYRTVTTMVYDYYGRPYPSSYSVFEGYRYLTTFIAGFDYSGNLLWNNDLELRNILSQSLKRRVIAWPDPEGLVLAYASDGKVVSKLINGSTTIENVSQSDIEPLNPRDRIFDDTNSSIEYWYNNYFIVYGYQNIRNSYVSSRNNKNVFYINKIAYY